MIQENYTVNNKVRLIRGGKEYFNLLVQLINQATDTIHLQTYIFENDETGRLIGNALMQAARRKINVFLLVDAYASQSLSKTFIKELKEAGVHFRFFETFFKTKHFYLGRRLHHKVVVTDTRYALVGGLNISNNYNEWNEHSAWLDFALYAEGEIAQQLCVLCWKGWQDFPRKWILRRVNKNQFFLIFRKMKKLWCVCAVMIGCEEKLKFQKVTSKCSIMRNRI